MTTRDLGPEEAATAEREAEAEADEAAAIENGEPRALSSGPNPELTVAFTPRQIIGGFALLAALLMLLRRRNRRDRVGRD